MLLARIGVRGREVFRRSCPTSSFSGTLASSSVTAVGASSTSVTVIVNARTIWPAGVPKSVARTRTEYVPLAS